MNIRSTPDWLGAALANSPRTTQQETEHLTGPSRGDLWVASEIDSLSSRRLVLVADIDDELGIISTMLTTNVVEASTDQDILLGRAQSGVPFDLLVETDVVGPLWRCQLEFRIARVPADWIPAISSSADPDFDSVRDAVRGVPLQGEGDWRVAFKQAEVREMQRLGRECVRFLLEPDVTPVCDPRLLNPDVADLDDCRALFRLIAERRAEVGGEVSWQLINDPSYKDRWLARFGWDAWAAVQMLLRPSPTSESRQLPMDVVVTPPRTDSRELPLLGLEAISRSVSGQRTLSIATRSRLWEDSPIRPRQFCCMSVEDKRFHVVREFVEG